MAKLDLTGIIDFIAHDRENKVSVIWVRIGGEFVKIERPMTKQFEWSRNKNETIQAGDKIRLSLEVLEG